MTKTAFLAVALLMAFFASAHARGGNESTACMPPSGYADDFRSYIVTLATSTDSVDQAVRTSNDIPAISDTTQIAFVTDSTVCATAAAAHAQAAQQSGAPLPVYVLRVGPTRYIVFNGQSAGEFFTYYVFDDRFSLLSSFAT